MNAVIAIVGRPNVGKSTLFNRLTRSRDALVDDLPGITRDRLYASIVYEGTPLTLIDTGGFDNRGLDPLLDKVKDQMEMALEEADKVIFMVDGRQGLIPGDEDMADALRRSHKKVVLAVNKIDGPEHDYRTIDFYKLGFDSNYPISAAHGYGIRSFMEALVKDIPKAKPETGKERQIRVAVLGRPNAGKSSLINRIVGFERLVVSEIPGTTRDSVDILFEWQGKEYLLIDTAGIRRKARIKEKIERFSAIKALGSLQRCHLAIILLDAEKGVAEQDARICGYALEQGKGVVLAVNKWDLVKKDKERKKWLDLDIERKLKFIPFVPRVNLSALTGERVRKLFDKIDAVFEQLNCRVSTGKVNRAIASIIEKHPPPRAGRGRLKFFYATQAGTKPPSYVLFVNKPRAIHFSYERFLSNQLRLELNLPYVPIRLKFRKR